MPNSSEQKVNNHFLKLKYFDNKVPKGRISSNLTSMPDLTEIDIN